MYFMTTSDSISAIGAATVGLVGTLVVLGATHKIIDSTMRTTGMYSKSRRVNKKHSIFGL